MKENQTAEERAKLDWIRNFAGQFIATWAAINHADYCGEDRSNDLVDCQPIDDALFIGEATYNNLFEMERSDNGN